jgi:2-iminoacetate synthase ThiH
MSEIRRQIHEAGRIPVQRDSLYNELKRFEPAAA